MKKKLLILFVILLVVLTGCSKKEEKEKEINNTPKITLDEYLPEIGLTEKDILTTYDSELKFISAGKVSARIRFSVEKPTVETYNEWVKGVYDNVLKIDSNIKSCSLLKNKLTNSTKKKDIDIPYELNLKDEISSYCFMYTYNEKDIRVSLSNKANSFVVTINK